MTPQETLIAHHKEIFKSWVSRDPRDFQRMLDFMHPDLFFVGSGLHELGKNREEFAAFIKQEHEETPIPPVIEAQWFESRVYDNLGFSLAMFDIKLPVEEHWHVMKDLRMSLVWVKQTGKWKIVHAHASAPWNIQQEGEGFPMQELQERNLELEKMVAEKTADLVLKNRELEVEAALERVRAASMAMQESSELPSVALVLVNQLAELNVQQLGSSIIIIDEEKETYRQYSAHDNLKDPEKILNAVQDFHLNEIHFGREILRLARSGENECTIELRGAPLREWMTYVKNKVHEQRGEAMLQAGFEGIYFYFAKFHGLSSIVISTLQPLPDTDKDILRRMANTFGMSYRRYLDLKKAEAQVREARIEATLERVRSRTLAMQKSKELTEVVDTIFLALQQLDYNPLDCTIVTFDHDSRKMDCWSSMPTRQGISSFSYSLPYIDHPMLNKMFLFHREQKPFLIYHLAGEEKVTYDDLFFEAVPIPEMEAILRAIPETNGNFIFMSHGAVAAFTPEPMSESDLALLQRFSKVVDLSYTRFLDLQKAEVQAREATRQASIDRVRAEIASMRTAEDLERITPLIWRELTTLGVPFFRCGVFIIREPDELVHAYLSTPEGQSLAVLHLPFDGAETTRNIVDNWRRQHIYADHWDHSQFQAWVQTMVDEGQLSEEQQYQAGKAPSESLSLQFIPFIQGMLYVGSSDPLSEDQQVLVKSLADAFSVAYARYEDFNSLEQAKNRVESTLTELKATQSQLIQQEKLASLGQLTAGIAHEIKNPLNFVNNFSEVSKELLDDLREEIKKGDWAEVEAIAADLQQNLAKIRQHGSRADGIVQAMLLHARGGSGAPELTDLNAFVREYVNLAYHGMRAGKEPINVTIDLDLNEQIGKAPLIAEDFSRVILNLCNNAFDAMRSKLQAGRENLYHPKLTVRTFRSADRISIEITDNGPGIPEAIRDKILQPFFTTKKGTEGTGLGLSISNDIVKAHGGKMGLRSAAGEQTSFFITLPTTSQEA